MLNKLTLEELTSRYLNLHTKLEEKREELEEESVRYWNCTDDERAETQATIGQLREGLKNLEEEAAELVLHIIKRQSLEAKTLDEFFNNAAICKECFARFVPHC